jgi:hypothetical protein
MMGVPTTGNNKENAVTVSFSPGAKTVVTAPTTPIMVKNIINLLIYLCLAIIYRDSLKYSAHVKF